MKRKRSRRRSPAEIDLKRGDGAARGPRRLLRHCRTPALAAVALALSAASAGAAPAPGEPSTAPAPPAATAPPSRDQGATVARIVKPLRALSRPGGPGPARPVSIETSWSGQATTLLVLASTTYRDREWVKLLLPDRPNGSTGWVPREFVVLRHTPYWVEVSTGRRTVSVYRGGHLVRRFRAVVGKPSTPTPHGLAAIYERVRQPDPKGFVGTWVLSLTILSDVLKHFEGGVGRIGIHGRSGTSLLDPLGSARSHGCIRISNGPVEWMAAHVPAGTPVRIRD
ncbi:MAG: L,D-transpeptidase [Actinobacteria bacterium]|nr:L,D-transpeptidase [Actinomycetota bacterium]